MLCNYGMYLLSLYGVSLSWLGCDFNSYCRMEDVCPLTRTDGGRVSSSIGLVFGVLGVFKNLVLDFDLI